MENLNLTELETKVLTNLIGNLYAEPGYSDVSVEDISRETGIPMKSIRGVISSLTKKEIISVYDNDHCSIVYLNEGFYYLHPEWSKYEEYKK